MDVPEVEAEALLLVVVVVVVVGVVVVAEVRPPKRSMSRDPIAERVDPALGPGLWRVVPVAMEKVSFGSLLEANAAEGCEQEMLTGLPPPSAPGCGG